MQELTYTISSIEAMGDYRIFKLIPDGELLKYRAGHFVVLSNGAVARPYSIASPPSYSYLEFLIHLVGGQFTSYLADVKVGERLTVKGPSGHFLYDGEEHVVLIGGGAGVAPLASITRHAITLKKRPKIHLFYSARYLHDAPYLSEFISYHNAGLIDLHFTITREEVTGFRHGRFSAEDVLALGDISDAIVFLCGSMAMAKAFREPLIDKVKNFKVEAWG